MQFSVRPHGCQICHINVLNIKLQGRSQLINRRFEQVCAFQVKLRLWVGQLTQCNYAHFQRCLQVHLMRPPRMLFLLGSCENNSKLYLQVSEPTINQAFVLFATPFSVTVDSVAIHLQMELIDLQCGTDLKTKLTEIATG